VNLFQRKSAILIVLSWAMLVAVACLWIAGWWWSIIIPLIAFGFCRSALPAPAKAKPAPVPLWINFLYGVAIALGVSASIEFDWIQLDVGSLWNHRGDWRLAVMAGSLILYRLVQDWRYFTRVPAEDIQQFIGEEAS
jgi:hypothetical protein